MTSDEIKSLKIGDVIYVKTTNSLLDVVDIVRCKQNHIHEVGVIGRRTGRLNMLFDVWLCDDKYVKVKNTKE